MNNEKMYPDITFEMQGKTVTLVLGLEALARYEEATGLNMLKSSPFEGLNLSRSYSLIWAALVTDQPNLTVEYLKKTLSEKDIISLLEAIKKAFVAATPPADPEKKSEEPQPNPQTENPPTG